jgi:hypothetical protein
VGTEVGRCTWLCGDWLWRLALVLDDDSEATSAAVTNGSLKASRKMNISLNFFVIFLFL